MNLKYELSKLAQLDLEDIWLHTVKTWSINQANKYYGLLFKEIEAICKNPNVGRPIDHVKTHHKIKHILSHMIVYKVKSNKIWIDRVLHKRMDFETKLNEGYPT